MMHQTAGLGGQTCMKGLKFFVKAVCYEEGNELMFSAFYALRIKPLFTFSNSPKTIRPLFTRTRRHSSPPIEDKLRGTRSNQGLAAWIPIHSSLYIYYLV